MGLPLPTYENRTRALGAGCILLTALFFATGAMHGQSASEYKVKAAYLYNFAKLAEWPPSLFLTPTSPVVFCVFGGDDDFVDVLRGSLATKSISNRGVVVNHVSSTADLDSCTLLFFRASENARVAGVISAMGTASTLLVGEDANFLNCGGMINLVLKDGKVRFQVNSIALDRANIRFDASFLSMAYGDTGSTRVQNSGTRAVRSNAAPEYPNLARQMNITGSVQLKLVVNADGSVKDVHVLGGHPLLAQAAVQAVRSWRYYPSGAESVETVRLNFGQ